MKKLLKNILPYIIIIVVVVLFRTFIATPVQVVGDSMYPNLKDDDILVLNKISGIKKEFKRFDIVVIKYNSETIIKRVIGLPDERIEYIDNTLYVNGEIIDEAFTHGLTADFNIEILGSTTVPEDSYLVLGDNREISKDSRAIGFIKRQDIIGKTSLRLFPIKNFGFIN